MTTLKLELAEPQFNLIWRALHARESELLEIIRIHGEDPEGEQAAFAGNDLIYLRLYRDELAQAARQAAFGEGAFSLSDDALPPA